MADNSSRLIRPTCCSKHIEFDNNKHLSGLNALFIMRKAVLMSSHYTYHCFINGIVFMQISRSSDPLFKDRLVVTSYEENTGQSGIKVWLLVLFLLGGGIAAGVYFWPQLSPHVDDFMAQVNAPATNTEAEPMPLADSAPASSMTNYAEAEPNVSTDDNGTVATRLSLPPATPMAEQTAEPEAEPIAEPETTESAAESTIAAVEAPTAATPEAETEVTAETASTEPETTEAVEMLAETASTEEAETAPAEAEVVENTATAEPESTELATAEASEATAAEAEPVGDNAAQVADLMKKAKRQLARTRLTSPEGDNAYETSQALRKLGATAEADEVENGILTWYHEQAQSYLDKQRLFPPGKSNAYTMYQRMFQIAPNHAQVQALQKTLIDSQQSLVKGRLKAGNIVAPEGESVYEVYQVLASYFPDAKETQKLRDNMIDTLLKRGERQLQQRKFTTPEDDNAYDTYSAILQIEENNAKGLAGLDKVVDEYVRLGRLRMKQGRYDHARTLVERGLQIAPDNEELLKLMESLSSRAQAPARSNVDLISLAQQQLASGHLSRPRGNNASETYERLKKKLPKTDQQLLGLGRQLGEAYFTLARQQFIDNQPEQSLKTVNQGLNVLGEHEKLARFQQELELLLDE